MLSSICHLSVVICHLIILNTRPGKTAQDSDGRSNKEDLHGLDVFLIDQVDTGRHVLFLCARFSCITRITRITGDNRHRVKVSDCMQQGPEAHTGGWEVCHFRGCEEGQL